VTFLLSLTLINSNVDVSIHRSPSAVLQFLSVGPDLVAIWGLKAKKYLAVDSKGKIFATVNFYCCCCVCFCNYLILLIKRRGVYLKVPLVDPAVL